MDGFKRHRQLLMTAGAILVSAIIALVGCAHRRATSQPVSTIPVVSESPTVIDELSPRSASPTPGKGSEPTATGIDSGTPQMHVCHVFIAEYEEQLGGMPASLETAYVAKDGTIQQTRERNDDTILALREGRVDVSSVFQSLNNLVVLSSDAESDSNDIVLPEYAGPTLLVEITFCNAPAWRWAGSPDDAPSALQELMSKAQALAQTVPSQPIIPGHRYIRSLLLTPDKVQQLRRADLVIDINREQLESSLLLKEAMAYERRLIRVPPGESPYGTIPLSFTFGKSAHIAYDQQVFQIRHLLVAEP